MFAFPFRLFLFNFPLFTTRFPFSFLGLAASALLPWLIRLASIYAKGAAVLMHMTRQRWRNAPGASFVASSCSMYLSPSPTLLCLCLLLLPLSLSVLVVVFVLARLSICKWCISGEKMLLMIYLHLALIYANVSLFPIVGLPDCLPPCLPLSLSLSLFAACFLWEFVISVSFRLGFFQFFMHARKLLWHF